MRRGHVFIGSDDAHVHGIAGLYDGFVVSTGGKAVRPIAAGKLCAIDPRIASALDEVQIFGACLRAALHDSFRHRGNGGLQISHANRSEEHTSELQSLMRISYAVFSFNTNTAPTTSLR